MKTRCYICTMYYKRSRDWFSILDHGNKNFFHVYEHWTARCTRCVYSCCCCIYRNVLTDFPSIRQLKAVERDFVLYYLLLLLFFSFFLSLILVVDGFLYYWFTAAAAALVIDIFVVVLVTFSIFYICGFNDVGEELRIDFAFNISILCEQLPYTYAVLHT